MKWSTLTPPACAAVVTLAGYMPARFYSITDHIMVGGYTVATFGRRRSPMWLDHSPIAQPVCIGRDYAARLLRTSRTLRRLGWSGVRVPAHVHAAAVLLGGAS